MRILLSGVLIWLILSTALRDALVLCAFELHQDYIAANLCINRDLQENMCHGHCQLKLKLAENHDHKDASKFTLLSDQLPITFYYQPQTQLRPNLSLLNMLSPQFSEGRYFSNFLFRFFRPPRF